MSDDILELLRKTAPKPPELKPKSPKKSSLSQAELEDVLRQAGWDEKDVPIMSAIGMAESALDKEGKALINSYNPGIGKGGKPTVEESVGLWQINMHPSLKRPYDRKKLAEDPVYNAKIALELYNERQKTGKKSGLTHWGAYTDGRYKQFYKGKALPGEPYQGESQEDIERILAETAPNSSELAPQGPNKPYEPEKLWPIKPLTQTSQTLPALSNGSQPGSQIGRNQAPQTPQTQSPLNYRFRPNIDGTSETSPEYEDFLAKVGLEDSNESRREFNTAMRASVEGANSENIKNFESYNREVDEYNKALKTQPKPKTKGRLVAQGKPASPATSVPIPQKDLNASFTVPKGANPMDMLSDAALTAMRNSGYDVSYEDVKAARNIASLENYDSDYLAQLSKTGGRLEYTLSPTFVQGALKAKQQRLDNKEKLKGVYLDQISKGVDLSQEDLQEFKNRGLEFGEIDPNLLAEARAEGDQRRAGIEANTLKYQKEAEKAFLEGKTSDSPFSAIIKARRDAGQLTASDAEIQIQIENERWNNYVKNSPELNSITQAKNLSFEDKFSIHAPGGDAVKAAREKAFKEYKSTIQDVGATYGNFTAKTDSDRKLAETYLYRPLAKPLEFAKGVAQKIAKLPALALDTISLSVDMTDPMGVTAPVVNELRNASEAFKKNVDLVAKQYKNKDFEHDFYANDVADAAGQFITQVVVAPLSGGLSLAVPMAEAVTGADAEARKNQLGYFERYVTNVIAGLAAVPDVLLQAKYLRVLSAGKQIQFIENFTKSLNQGLTLKVGETAGKSLTARIATAYLPMVFNAASKPAFGYLVEREQEKWEDIVNKTVQKVLVDPNIEVFNPSKAEQRGYDAAGLIGAVGGSLEAVTERMTDAEIKAAALDFPNLLKEAGISSVISAEIANKLAAEIIRVSKARHIKIDTKPLSPEAIQASLKAQIQEMVPGVTPEQIVEYAPNEDPKLELVDDEEVSIEELLASTAPTQEDADKFNFERRNRSQNIPPQVRAELEGKNKPYKPSSPVEKNDSSAISTKVDLTQQTQALNESNETKTEISEQKSPVEPPALVPDQSVEVPAETKSPKKTAKPVVVPKYAAKNIHKQVVDKGIDPNTPAFKKISESLVGTSKLDSMTPDQLTKVSNALVRGRFDKLITAPKTTNVEFKEGDDVLTGTGTYAIVNRVDPDGKHVWLEDLDTDEITKHLISTVKTKNDPKFFKAAIDHFATRVKDDSNFKDFFEDSRIVDHRGNPKIMYHGAIDFKGNQFDPRESVDFGFHFGDIEQANDRVRKMGDYEHGKPFMYSEIIPVILSIKKPLRLADTGSWGVTQTLNNLRENAPGVLDLHEIRRVEKESYKSTKAAKELLTTLLESKGYDGIVYTNEYEGETHKDSYIAFRPEQVKSIFNSGKWGKQKDTTQKNPDLHKAVRSQTLFDKRVLGEVTKILSPVDLENQVNRNSSDFSSKQGPYKKIIASGFKRFGPKFQTILDLIENKKRGLIRTAETFQNSPKGKELTKGSQLVNRDGTPILFFHFTRKEFEEFNEKRIWFTPIFEFVFQQGNLPESYENFDKYVEAVEDSLSKVKSFFIASKNPLIGRGVDTNASQAVLNESPYDALIDVSDLGSYESGAGELGGIEGIFLDKSLVVKIPQKNPDLHKSAADKIKALGATGTAAQWINRNEGNIKNWNDFLKAGPQNEVIGIGLEPNPTKGILLLKDRAEAEFKDKSSIEKIEKVSQTDLNDYLKNLSDNNAQVENEQIQREVWAYKSDPKGATTRIQEFIRNNRQDALQEWHEYLTKGNPIYAKDPFFRDWVWVDLIKLRDKRPDLPLGLDKAALAAVYDDVKNRPNSSAFQKLYERKVQELMLKDAEANEILSVPDGTWIKIPQTDRDAPNFKENVAKVQAVSRKEWCTSQGMAEAYLPMGSFWVLVKNNKSELAFRFSGDAVAEIQGKENNGTIPEEFLEDIKDLIRAKNEDGSEKVPLTISSMDQILRALRESKFKAKLVPFIEERTKLYDEYNHHENSTINPAPIPENAARARSIVEDAKSSKKGWLKESRENWDKEDQEFWQKGTDLFLKHFDPEYKEPKKEKTSESFSQILSREIEGISSEQIRSELENYFGAPYYLPTEEEDAELLSNKENIQARVSELQESFVDGLDPNLTSEQKLQAITEFRRILTKAYEAKPSEIRKGLKKAELDKELEVDIPDALKSKIDEAFDKNFARWSNMWQGVSAEELAEHILNTDTVYSIRDAYAEKSEIPVGFFNEELQKYLEQKIAGAVEAKRDELDKELGLSDEIKAWADDTFSPLMQSNIKTQEEWEQEVDNDLMNYELYSENLFEIDSDETTTSEEAETWNQSVEEYRVYTKNREEIKKYLYAKFNQIKTEFDKELGTDFPKEYKEAINAHIDMLSSGDYGLLEAESKQELAGEIAYRWNEPNYGIDPQPHYWESEEILEDPFFEKAWEYYQSEIKKIRDEKKAELDKELGEDTNYPKYLVKDEKNGWSHAEYLALSPEERRAADTIGYIGYIFQGEVKFQGHEFKPADEMSEQELRSELENLPKVYTDYITYHLDNNRFLKEDVDLEQFSRAEKIKLGEIGSKNYLAWGLGLTLDKKADLNKELQKAVNYDAELEKYRNAKFNREFITKDFTAKVDKDGNIEISPKVAVTISRVEKHLGGQIDQLFLGGMMRSDQLTQYVPALNELIATAPKTWTKKDLAPLVKVYQTLKAQISKKQALLYVDKSKIPHEMQHKLRYIYSGYKEYVQEYYKDFDGLYKSLEAIHKEAYEEYFSRMYFNHKPYDKLTQNDKAYLHEEMFAHIADGQYYELGLTIKQAAKFLDITIKAYIEQNGHDILEAQEKWINAENKEIIKKFLKDKPKPNKGKSSRRRKSTRKDPEGDGKGAPESPDSNAEADLGPRLERAYPQNVARHTQLNLEDLDDNTRFYYSQARSPIEQEAATWLRDVGINVAYLEAFNQPVTNLGVAKRQAVMSYLDAQVSHYSQIGDLPRANAVYERLLSLVSAISPETTEWGQAISQMAHWSHINPDATIYTLEDLRRRNGKKAPLSVETTQKVKDLAKEIKALDSDLLTIESILRDSNNQDVRKSLESTLKLNSKAIKTLKKAFGKLKPAMDSRILKAVYAVTNRISVDTLEEDTKQSLLTIGKKHYLQGKEAAVPPTLDEWKTSIINELNDEGIDTREIPRYLDSTYVKVKEIVKRELLEKSIERAKKKHKVNTREEALEKIYEEKAERAKKTSIEAKNLREAKAPKEKRTNLRIALDNAYEEISNKTSEDGTAIPNPWATVEQFIDDMALVKDRGAFYKKYTKEGLTPSQVTNKYREAMDAFLEIDREMKAHRKSIRDQKEMAAPGGFRQLTPKEALEYERQLKEKRIQRGQKLTEFHSMVKHLTDRPETSGQRLKDWYLRMNRAGETAMTAAMSTMTHNVIAQRGVKLLNTLEVIGEVAISKLERKIGKDVFSKNKFSPHEQTRIRDIIIEELYGSSLPSIRAAAVKRWNNEISTVAILGTAINYKQNIAQGVLAYNPDLYDAMTNKFSYGDEDLKTKPIDESYGAISKTVERGVRAVETAISWATYLNGLQEKHFRFATFIATLAVELKARGIDPDLVLSGNNIEVVSRFELERAVKRALEDTYGEDPPRNGELVKYIAVTSNAMKWIPFPLNPVLYRRFLINSTKFLIEHSPLVLAKMAGENGMTARDAMKGISGMGMFMLATMLLSQFSSDDDDPLTLTIMGTTFKMQAYNPLSSFLILASIYHRYRKGKAPLKRLSELWKLFGIDTRYPNLAAEWMKAMIAVADGQETARYFKFGDISAQVAGRGVAGYFKVFSTIKSIQMAFDEEEATIRDYYDEPFFGELKKTLPLSELATKLVTGRNSRKKEEAVTGNTQIRDHNILDQLGISIVNKNQIGPKLSPAEDYLDVALRHQRAKNQKFHKTPEERRASAIAAQLYVALDKGVDPETVIKRADHYANLGSISDKSAKDIAKATRFKTTLERQASQATIETLVESLDYATSQEKEVILDFLAEKFKNQVKSKTLTDNELKALISVFPELGEQP